MRDGQTWKLTVILFAMLSSFSLFGQTQQLPSQKYPIVFEDDNGEEYYFDPAWMRPLPDGGFIGRAWDVDWMYRFNAALDLLSVGVLPTAVTNSGVLYNGSLLHVSFDVNIPVDGVPPNSGRVAAVVLTTPDGDILEQHALVFPDMYNSEGPPLDQGNQFIDSNGGGESFVLMESSWPVLDILKLSPTGMPLWQARLPEDKTVFHGPIADAERGCWVGITWGTDPGMEILRLDSMGNVVFWNLYDLPGSTFFGKSSSLYDNGSMGLTICGVDSSRLTWMNINHSGQVTSYRAYPTIDYPLTSATGPRTLSMGWTGSNWAMCVGGYSYRPSMMVFCTFDGTPERAYKFLSPVLVGDTITNWHTKVEYTRRPRAVMTGYITKEDSAGNTFPQDKTVTVLPNGGPWEHCMTEEIPVPEQVLISPDVIVVTPVAANVTYPPLPYVAPSSIISSTLPLFSQGPLCIGPMGVEEVQKARDLWVEQTVVDRGTPLRFQAGGHIALLDPAGRFVIPWTKVPDRMGSMATGQLAPGVYLLVLRAEDDMAVRLARVVVQ